MPFHVYSVLQRVTKRCRLSWMTNSPNAGGRGVTEFQPFLTLRSQYSCAHGAQINPYLTYAIIPSTDINPYWYVTESENDQPAVWSGQHPLLIKSLDSDLLKNILDTGTARGTASNSENFEKFYSGSRGRSVSLSPRQRKSTIKSERFDTHLHFAQFCIIGRMSLTLNMPASSLCISCQLLTYCM